MTAIEATAEVFLTALRALPREQRDEVLRRIADQKDLRKDLLDLALIAECRDEPSQPLDEWPVELPR